MFGHAGGPVLLGDMNKATVHASENMSARHLIQTQFEDVEDVSLMTEKDSMKLKKRSEKEEKVQRAVLAAHEVHAQICLKSVPFHLEDCSVFPIS